MGEGGVLGRVEIFMITRFSLLSTAVKRTVQHVMTTVLHTHVHLAVLTA